MFCLCSAYVLLILYAGLGAVSGWMRGGYEVDARRMWGGNEAFS